MRRLALTLTIAAACTVAGAAFRAEAAVIGPNGLRAAAEDIALTAPVHCRPGRWHHRRGPPDGCWRRYHRVYPGPYAHYGPYGPYRGGFYGPGFYGGPGISLHFGVGPRRWGRW